MINIIKSFFDRFPFFRRTQQVREVAVNHSDVGSNPTGEAKVTFGPSGSQVVNSTPWASSEPKPWKPDYQDNWPWAKKPVKFDKTNTIVLTEKTMELTVEQQKAVLIDDFRDEIKLNCERAKIYRHNTHKPQKNVKRRCRKLIDAANECFETKVVTLRNGKTKTVKTEKIKEGKLEAYKKYMADAKALAKTLRSRQTRPFNSTIHFKRTVTIRKEQRSSHIAYGFIKKKLYHEIEDNPRWKNAERHPGGEHPDWIRIRKLIMQYTYIDPKADRLQIEFELKETLDAWKGN